MKANWNREPWFCQSCILGTNKQPDHQNTVIHENVAQPDDALQTPEIETAAIARTTSGQIAMDTESTLNPSAIEFIPPATPSGQTKTQNTS